MKPEPFRLERYFAEYEFTTPWLMCSSDCESMTVGELLGFEPGAEERLSSLWLGYTESAGDPELRDEIAGLYDRISRDGILVHSGAEEAIFNFMNVALDPGDHVVVHSPYYQSLGAVASALGAEVAEWRGDRNRAWSLDLDALERSLTGRTRLVVINLPHNPTGWLPDAGFLQDLSALSERHGFMVFSDEVYRGLEHDPAERLPAMADLNERAVSLGVMSKTYGLPGLRIGWIATNNARLLERMAAFKDYTTICNSAPSELLAALALRHRDSIVERNLGIARRNLDLLDAFFERRAERFLWQRPPAGPIAFPTLLQGEVDSFCRALVRDAGLLLLPGTLYGKGYNEFRIGFGRRNLPECLEILERFLESSPLFRRK